MVTVKTEPRIVSVVQLGNSRYVVVPTSCTEKQYLRFDDPDGTLIYLPVPDLTKKIEEIKRKYTVRD